MKNYKYLIPAALVVLMGASVYTMFSNATKKEEEYNGYLKKAREDAKLEVVEESIENYGKALVMKDDIDLRIEAGNVYVQNGWTSEAVYWGEQMIEDFPKEAKAYTFLLEQYIQEKDYKECFSLQKQAVGRKAVNDSFQELISKIEYKYEMGLNTYQDVTIYSNDLCAVQSSESGLWGYAKLNGEIEISPKFEWTGAFTGDGIAPVKTEDGEFYFISDTGNKKLAVQNIKDCEDLGLSINGIISAKDGDFYAYYNQDFEKIAGDYLYATAINGVGAVQEKKGWYLVDENGEKLTKKAYESVVTDEKGIVYRNERCFVSSKDQIVMIDKDGNEIGKKKFEDAKLFGEADSYAAVEIDGKWGFVDKDGNVVIAPQFGNARSFVNGYAAVEIDGKWGFINTDGKTVIDAVFEDARDFNRKGRVFVKTEGQWQLLKLLKDNYE